MKLVMTGRANHVALLYLVMGAAVAALAPWGFAMGAMPEHTPALRAALLVVMGATGLLMARQTGLRIMPTGLAHPVRAALLIGAALALYLLVIDAVAFRSVIPPEYRAFITGTSLPTRIIYFVLRSFNEGIIYQLFFGSTFVALIGLAWRNADGKPADGAYWCGLILAHLVNIAINLHMSAAPMMLTYDALRFVAPGVLWAWLYWRHGLTTALLTHAATHVFLQPLLGIAL